MAVATRLVQIPPYGATVIAIRGGFGTRFCSRLLANSSVDGYFNPREFQNIKLL